jgi:hypothetical protein
MTVKIANAIFGRETPTTRTQSDGSPSTDLIAARGNHLKRKNLSFPGQITQEHTNEWRQLNAACDILARDFARALIKRVQIKQRRFVVININVPTRVVWGFWEEEIQTQENFLPHIQCDFESCADILT